MVGNKGIRGEKGKEIEIGINFAREDEDTFARSLIKFVFDEF